MTKPIIQSVIISAVLFVLTACGGATKTVPDKVEAPKLDTPVVVVKCTTPRPQMCTRQFDPVCGTALEAPACKPGMLCAAVMLPTKKTYSNSCTACSNPNVQSHTAGACS